jgi:hypothetical protein
MLIKNRSYSAEKISRKTNAGKGKRVYRNSSKAKNLEMSEDSVEKNIIENFVG